MALSSDLSQDDLRAAGVAFLSGKSIGDIALHFNISRRSVEGILRAQWRTLINAATVTDSTGQLVTADKLRTVATLLPPLAEGSAMVSAVLFAAADRLAPLDAVLTAAPENAQTEPSNVH